MDEDSDSDDSLEDTAHEATCPSCGHTVEHECRFGTPCGVPITDTSIGGLERHFLQYHAADLSCAPRSGKMQA